MPAGPPQKRIYQRALAKPRQDTDGGEPDIRRAQERGGRQERELTGIGESSGSIPSLLKRMTGPTLLTARRGVSNAKLGQIGKKLLEVEGHGAGGTPYLWWDDGNLLNKQLLTCKTETSSALNMYLLVVTDKKGNTCSGCLSERLRGCHRSC